MMRKKKRGGKKNRTHLPSSNTGDDDNKGEGDHGKSHEDTHFEQIILERSLVLSVDSGKWLRTERISHGFSCSNYRRIYLSIELGCFEEDAVLLQKVNLHLRTAEFNMTRYALAKQNVLARGGNATPIARALFQGRISRVC